MISIDFSVFIVILNFLLLLIILKSVMYAPLKKFLEERKKKISQDIDEAKKFKDDAELLVQEKEKELKKASIEGREIREIAQKDAEIKADSIISDAKEKEKKIILETQVELEHERAKVVKGLEKEISSMISSLTSKLVEGKMDEKEDDLMISKLLSQRGKSEK